MEEMKSVQKSVRLTPSAYRVINEYRGDGFNEKLSNLLGDYITRRDQLVAEWNLLNASVSDKRQELTRIKARVMRAAEVEHRLEPLVKSVADLLSME